MFPYLACNLSFCFNFFKSTDKKPAMLNPSQPERISTSRKGNGCRFLFLFLICSSWCQIRYQRPEAPWPGQETCWGLCQHLAKNIGPKHQAPDVSVAAGGLGQGMTMGEHSRGTSISETCLLRDAPSASPTQTLY